MQRSNCSREESSNEPAHRLKFTWRKRREGARRGGEKKGKWESHTQGEKKRRDGGREEAERERELRQSVCWVLSQWFTQALAFYSCSVWLNWRPSLPSHTHTLVFPSLQFRDVTLIYIIPWDWLTLTLMSTCLTWTLLTQPHLKPSLE